MPARCCVVRGITFTIREGIIRGMSKFWSLGRIRRTGWLTLPTWWDLSTNVSNQTQLPRVVWQEFPHCCHGNIHLKLAKLLDLHLCHGSIQWVSTRLALGMRDIFVTTIVSQCYRFYKSFEFLFVLTPLNSL